MKTFFEHGTRFFVCQLIMPPREKRWYISLWEPSAMEELICDEVLEVVQVLLEYLEKVFSTKAVL